MGKLVREKEEESLSEPDEECAPSGLIEGEPIDLGSGGGTDAEEHLPHGHISREVSQSNVSTDSFGMGRLGKRRPVRRRGYKESRNQKDGCEAVSGRHNGRAAGVHSEMSEISNRCTVATS